MSTMSWFRRVSACLLILCLLSSCLPSATAFFFPGDDDISAQSNTSDGQGGDQLVNLGDFENQDIALHPVWQGELPQSVNLNALECPTAAKSSPFSFLPHVFVALPGLMPRAPAVA